MVFLIRYDIIHVSSALHDNNHIFKINIVFGLFKIFKCQFCDWDEALAVDFTRTADSVARRGVDINQILEKDKPATDLRALLAPRETPLTNEEALQMMAEWNDELIEPPEENIVESSSALQQFIMVDGKWNLVENRWFGQFFNQDSYILIARYWVMNMNA